MTADADRPADRLTCASCGEVMTPDSRPAAHLRPAHGASRPADVREVLGDVLCEFGARAEALTFDQQADVLLAALSAAGLTAVPAMAETVQYCVTPLGRGSWQMVLAESREQALHLADELRWVAMQQPVAGPWVPVQEIIDD